MLRSVQTALLFNEGDPFAIDLAYNGDLRMSFVVLYAGKLNNAITIEMEVRLELRNQNILASWKATTVVPC